MIRETARKIEIIKANTADGNVKFQQKVAKIIISPATSTSYGVTFNNDYLTGDKNSSFVTTGRFVIDYIITDEIILDNAGNADQDIYLMGFYI